MTDCWLLSKGTTWLHKVALNKLRVMLGHLFSCCQSSFSGVFFVAFCFGWMGDSTEWQETRGNWGGGVMYSDCGLSNSNQKHWWHVVHLTYVQRGWTNYKSFQERNAHPSSWAACHVFVIRLFFLTRSSFFWILLLPCTRWPFAHLAWWSQRWL